MEKKKHRPKTWREGLHERLQNPKYAEAYILGAMKEGLDLEIALKDVIAAVGVARYSRKVKGLERPNVYKFVGKGRNPTLRTIRRLLEPLGLDIGVVKMA
ncbi:MAG TPA: hypothetical protein VI895_08060 [Bdellovibrionota bacterium]|nr:hypothetical protein [Bdellovibrionota bacterium]